MWFKMNPSLIPWGKVTSRANECPRDERHTLEAARWPGRIGHLPSCQDALELIATQTRSQKKKKRTIHHLGDFGDFFCSRYQVSLSFLHLISEPLLFDVFAQKAQEYLSEKVYFRTASKIYSVSGISIRQKKKCTVRVRRCGVGTQKYRRLIGQEKKVEVDRTERKSIFGDWSGSGKFLILWQKMPKGKREKKVCHIFVQ